MRLLCSALLVASICLVVSKRQVAIAQETAESGVPDAVQAALDQLRQEQQKQLDDLRREHADELELVRAELAALTAAPSSGATAGAGLQFEVNRYYWAQGSGPVKMIHKDEGVCFLTRVGGGFQGGGEVVLIQLDEDGYYYLTGGSHQSGVHAEATSVRFLSAASLDLTPPLKPDGAAIAEYATSLDDNTESPLATEETEQPQRRKLPGVYDGIAVGGGGRYLFFGLKTMRKLAIFDTHEAKITKYIGLPADDALFAAGRDKLLIVLPTKRIIQRYSLADFSREASQVLPIEGTVTALAMGSASDGPLLVQTRGEFGSGQVSLLDIEKLQKLDVQFEGDAHSLGDSGALWASAAGNVFGVSRNGSLTTLVVHGSQAKAYNQQSAGGHAIPSPDGTIIFTATGLYTPEGRRLSPSAELPTFSFPSAHPAYYLSLSGIGQGRMPGFSDGQQAPQLSIHTTSDQQLLLTLPPMDDLLPSDDFNQLYDLNSRVYFVPEAKRLITIPATRDALLIRDLDIVKALERADVDYLFVDSLPVRTAKRGELYRYPILIQSRLKGVSFVLDSGVEGMAISPAGELTWQVPNDFAEDRLGVIVTVTDASQKEVLHSFDVQVN